MQKLASSSFSKAPLSIADTAVSVASDASLDNVDLPSLVGTCQCLYSNVPGPTDLFKIPDSGNCANVNLAELVTN